MVPRGVGSLTIRVAVAAESAVERAGLAALLTGSPAITLVHATEHVRDLEAIASAHDVDVVVIALRASSDLALPLQLTPDRAHSAPALVVLIDNAPIDWLAAAYARGVFAVFPRDVRADELHGAVQSAGAGLVTLTRENYAALGVGARVMRTSTSANNVEALTPRETEILGMLADGLANKEIAVRLNISSHTVKTHVQSLFTKLGADTRAEAVAVGVRRGLILL